MIPNTLIPIFKLRNEPVLKLKAQGPYWYTRLMVFIAILYLPANLMSRPVAIAWAISAAIAFTLIQRRIHISLDSNGQLNINYFIKTRAFNASQIQSIDVVYSRPFIFRLQVLKVSLINGTSFEYPWISWSTWTEVGQKVSLPTPNQTQYLAELTTAVEGWKSK